MACRARARIVEKRPSTIPGMFSFIKKKLGWGSADPETTPANPAQAPAPAKEAAAEASPQHALRPAGSAPQATPTSGASTPQPPAAVAAAQPLAPSASPAEPTRRSWLDKLRNGLRKTGSSIAQVFTGTQIDDAPYEELEAALLMADAGVAATEHLLQDLKRRVKEAKATDPSQVKGLLIDAITDLLQPLEKSLEVGEHTPTVIMVAGVNGAGKTTTIGKLTRHLSDAGQRVLLAAADTFRAARRGGAPPARRPLRRRGGGQGAGLRCVHRGPRGALCHATSPDGRAQK